MKKIPAAFILLLCACNSHDTSPAHIRELAQHFTEDSVFAKMKGPGSYTYLGAKIDTYTVTDYIKDYRFVYDHLSFNRYDSTGNKRALDSIIRVHKDPDSIIRITVEVGYKLTYPNGNAETDSVRLGYNRETGQVTYWPF